MKTFIAFISISVILFAACQKNDDKPVPAKEVDEKLKSEITDQNNNFSVDIFRRMVANDSVEKNVFISPLSMYYALAMAGIGSDGDTRQEFNSVLGWSFANDSLLMEAMKQITADIKPTNNKITLEIANSLWQNPIFEVYQTYKDNVSNYFDAEVKELDVTNPDAVNIINSWIENKTHDKIKDMLDAIPNDVLLYLINAIYFKGDWKYTFDEKYTADQNFTTTGGSIKQVPFMNQETYVNYLKTDQFKMIELPYADSNYSMVMMLPINQTVGDLISQIDMNKWIQWQNQATRKLVKISIPKFKFGYGTRAINDELMDMGLVSAFNGANFSKMTPMSVAISRVLHKSFIEVNEKGSEAAAVTIVEIRVTSTLDGESDPVFTADHPFIFAICHKPTNTLLFMGKVADPSKN
jgi:serpin B